MARYPALPYDKHITPESSGAHGGDSVVIAAASENVEKKGKSLNNGQYDEEHEIPSMPRGFFYKFDYPVNLIAETPSRRSARLQQERESEQHEGTQKVRRHHEEGHVVETKVESVDSAPTVQLKNTDEKPQLARVSLRATEEGAIPVDAVHDAQVHPNQRAGLVNSQIMPVAIGIE